jgi:putative transcriptional regulator
MPKMPAINVKALRERLNLSQPEFARRYGFNLGTLRQWERGRTSPDEAAQSLLAVINHSPDTVVEALRVAS